MSVTEKTPTPPSPTLVQGTGYFKHFDAKGYLDSRFSSENGKLIDRIQPLYFQLQSFHDFYSEYGSTLDPNSARLLEFGGGPVIYQAISAVPYVKEVVFADYTDGCRKEINLWLTGDPAAHNWTPFFREVVSGYEGKEEMEAATEREEQLRQRIVAVVPCNIHADTTIDPELGKFDVISTSYCLESVNSTLAQYEDAFRKLGQLVKDGGYIVTLISLEMSWYTTVAGGKKFEHLSLTSDNIRSALEKAGFAVVMHRRCDLPERFIKSGQNDCRAKDFFVGRKISGV